MKLVFCHNENFKWKYDEFISIMDPNFSPDGSNKKVIEISTYKAFIDVIDYCFNDGMFGLF